MKREIERRFLVRDPSWRAGASSGALYRQAYLHAEPGCTIRIRQMQEPEGRRAWLTIKGRTEGLTRDEFEYLIPAAEGERLFAMATAGQVEKRRYTLEMGGCRWEIDVFEGDNAGLVLAEIELESEDQDFPRPDWLGEEVTHDARYANASLASRPYNRWKLRGESA